MSYQYWPIKRIPFICSYCNPLEFPGNYHAEIEMLYCVEGEFTVSVESTMYTIKPGQALIIGSGMAHERLAPSVPTQVVFIKFGPILLGEFYSELSGLKFTEPLFEVDDPRYDFKDCFDIFEEFCKNYGGNEGLSYHDWMVKSCILRLSTIILEKFPYEKKTPLKRGRGKISSRIEMAMSFIEDNFRFQISVEDVAGRLGYEKTYFCKIFKESTGVTFHKFLNRYRINIAKSMLHSTESSIGEIASLCGFAQFKTFCKVFKSETGMTPSEYRSSR